MEVISLTRAIFRPSFSPFSLPNSDWIIMTGMLAVLAVVLLGFSE